MTAPSWVGDTVIARCGSCGHLYDAPSYAPSRGGSSYCSVCETASRHSYWSGPLAVIDR